MFVGKAGATNIRLGWKGLPETNTLAYYEKSVNYGSKKFYSTDPWGPYMKRNFLVYHNEQECLPLLFTSTLI